MSICYYFRLTMEGEIGALSRRLDNLENKILGDNKIR